MNGIKPTVMIMRGYGPNSGELRAWNELNADFDIKYLVPRRHTTDLSTIEIKCERVSTLRDYLPRGRLGDVAGYIAKDRYFKLAEILQDVDIVHAAELHNWYTAQAARLKDDFGFILVATVWETIPFLHKGRHFLRTRRYREEILQKTDLFLPTTERARDCLLLEGVPNDKIALCRPGIDIDMFNSKADLSEKSHTVLSVGRLVWEKGHQDVLRACAAIHKGIVDSPIKPKVWVVGTGPELKKLQAYSDDLGIRSDVTFLGGVAHSEMPEVYSRASCLVLASLATRSWEEQFGYVLIEAMASGLHVLASNSGAISEVLDDAGTLFTPGDWLGLANSLAIGPLRESPQVRFEEARARARVFSIDKMSTRLNEIYTQALNT